MTETIRTRPTWDQLVAAEPLLAELLQEARAHRAIGQPFCANEVWYGYGERRSMRQRLSNLIGYSRVIEVGPYKNKRPHPVLGTSDAYDVAYDTLYSALPDCEANCACQTLLRGAVAMARHDGAILMKIEGSVRAYDDEPWYS